MASGDGGSTRPAPANRAVPVTGVLLSLWRAAAVFRIVAVAFCLYLIIRWRDIYAEPAVAFGVGGAMLLVTGVVTVWAFAGRAHRLAFVSADLAICIVLTVLTRAAQHPSQFHGDMPTLTSVWAAGPAIEAGLLLGSIAGIVAGLLQFVASIVVREGYDGHTLANGLLLLIVGGIAGYLATFTLRAEQERALAAAEGARLAERDRLTRSIHDGVLQILGLVHRRGLAAGGQWAELGQEAAAQEAALRALITSQSISPTPTGLRNLAGDLTALRSTRVTVSVPDAPVLLASHDAGELLDVVRAALDNVEQHAGPDAKAWVFLEDLGGEVVVTVRDDGVGIRSGRLDEAVSEGRLGVAESIRGRIADLGGRVKITSSPAEGTEVEIVTPSHHSTGSEL
jgi:signal transduction histidine kinase